MDAIVRGVGISSADAMMTGRPPRSPGRYDMAEVPVMDEGAPMPPERSSRPFTELLDRAITEQSFSLTQVARRVDQAAAKDNQRLATTKQQVYRWRHGPQVPEPQVVRWIATALDRPVEEFAVAAHQQRQLLSARAQLQPSPADSAGAAPASYRTTLLTSPDVLMS